MTDINIDNEKKLLIELVFKKAGEESLKTAKNSRASYLSDEVSIGVSARGLVRYYDEIIIKNNITYEIDRVSLDRLSEYLGYENFKDFYEKSKVKEERQEEIEIKQETAELHEENNNPEEAAVEEKQETERAALPSSTFISIHQGNTNTSTATNTAHLLGYQEATLDGGNNATTIQTGKEPDSSKNLHLYLLCFSGALGILLTGATIYNWPAQEEKRPDKIGVVNIPCAIWKNDHYESLPCNQLKSRDEVLYYDEYIRSFKKITRPDTLTNENSEGKVWYDKSNNEYEFFTNYGIHPENGKTLKPLTSRILDSYMNSK